MSVRATSIAVWISFASALDVLSVRTGWSIFDSSENSASLKGAPHHHWGGFDRLHHLELGLSEALLLEEYSPDSLVPGDSEDDEGTPFDRVVQEARLAKASKQLDQLGKVNPLALEEFNALEDRHTFLKEQLEDLSKTRKDLESIMEDLDSQASIADIPGRPHGRRRPPPECEAGRRRPDRRE